MTIPDEVLRVFREVFDDEELRVHDDTTANDIDGWDSLMHINLIIALESEFGVKFATAEIADLKENGRTVADMVSLLEEKTGRPI